VYSATAGGASLPVTAPDFVSQEISDTLFLVDPYVPREGIVFFHGKKSLGKSPLTWELARCVALGQSFLGRPTSKGRVLYVEADTPPILVRKRLQKLPGPLPTDWYLEFTPPFNVLIPNSPAVNRLRTIGRDLSPELVIINTLRKVHYADDKESDVPVRVYGAFQDLFPHAALWFTHHDKKSGDPTIPRDPAEEHSGSAAWRNDAQVALHLVKNGAGKGVLRLDHTGSQVSELAEPIVLQLEDDGSNIGLHSRRRAGRVEAVYQALDPDLTVRERVTRTAHATGMSESTVWRALRDLKWIHDSGGADGELAA
jgi:hypothetical protein